MAVILVVEDEKDIREGIVELLGKEHQVFQAATGKEALDLIDREGLHINAVLLDIVLPDMNGIEVLKKIKTDFMHLDVIMVTVLKNIPTAVNCLKEGAYDYVTKPFIQEDLLATIKRALEKEEIERDFRFYSEKMKKRNLDFEHRRIMLEELRMKRKLEGADIPPKECAQIMYPGGEKEGEDKSWEAWEKDLQNEIKTQPPQEKTAKANILVIEDELDIREGLLEVLGKKYSPAGAGSAAEALAALQNKKFDVILLDIILPDRSGLEILPEIKKLNPESRVIMTTVLKGLDTAIAAMKLGAYDYVTKPIVMEELAAAIDRVVSVLAARDRVCWMMEQLKRERLPESLRKELFQALMEKRKLDGKEIIMDDIFAFFPELRGDWAEKEWRCPGEAIESVGIDEMIKRFKEQKRHWEEILRQDYKL